MNGFPFAPLQASATVGATVKVTANDTPTSVSGSLVNTAARQANTIRVCNAGTVLVFVRVSAESVPTATASDIPIPAGESLLIQNPVGAGTAGLAALSSTTTACDVYFTPGEGGV